MRRRGNIFLLFSITFTISLVILVLSQKNLLNGPTGILESLTIPLQRLTHNTIKTTPGQLEKLQQENADLKTKLAKEKELEKENRALHDQFATDSIQAKKLLPAHIIGSPSFIPNVSSVTSVIIDKGEKEGIKRGSVVIYKDNLVGKAFNVYPHESEIYLPTYKDIALSVITSDTQTLGVLRGEGVDGMLLDNVVLSDTLKPGDTVVTKGDMDTKGEGYPADLVVGKIISVHKRNSALFQNADIQSLLDFKKLDTVFVMQ